MRNVDCGDWGGKALWGAAKDGRKFAEDLEIKCCLCEISPGNSCETREKMYWISMYI